MSSLTTWVIDIASQFNWFGCSYSNQGYFTGLAMKQLIEPSKNNIHPKFVRDSNFGLKFLDNKLSYVRELEIGLRQIHENKNIPFIPMAWSGKLLIFLALNVNVLTNCSSSHTVNDDAHCLYFTSFSQQNASQKLQLQIFCSLIMLRRKTHFLYVSIHSSNETLLYLDYHATQLTNPHTFYKLR